jgi:hypothetical protein
MAETSVPKALEGLTVSKTKELKGVGTTANKRAHPHDTDRVRV